MADTIKVAGVQMDVQLGDSDANLVRMEEALETTAKEGATLTVFPECALSGYCFDSLEEASPYGESIPGPSTQRLAETCHRLGIFTVYGLLESHGSGLFNACALIGPDGLVASYRKIHLPYLGIDRFTTAGDRPFAVHATGQLRIGMNICYDSAFPESARVMSLAGADLIVLPTNFPPGSECMIQHVVHARAMENGVYYIAVNRVGQERGFPFIGQSKICDPDGKALAEAPADEEAILYADIDLPRARNKHRVRVPKQHEINRFADRRPSMYGPVTEST
ncbi:MAG: carbon-nitrogen hydrolase family protein [Planctomycetota bacterium]|nr:carbon-nitrogen hydrolase family protein [Planctomycetota bacterium]